MKKIIYILALCAGIGCTQAKNGSNTNTQGADSNKTIQGDPDKPKVDTNYIGKAAETNPAITYIPAFEITTIKNAKFTQADLKKNKPLMVMYFSPDCTHCIDFISKLKPRLKELANVQILMVSWIRLEAIQPFYQQSGLSAYPNIVMGTEGNENLLIQQYFQVKETPYIALYNRHGKLAWYYEKAPRIDHLLSKAKNL